MRQIYKTSFCSIGFGVLVYFVTFTPALAQVFVNESSCEAVGNWDASADTCTLMDDVTEPLIIDTAGVTVDGNGYAVTTLSDWNDSAVYISAPNVTISNLRVMSPARYGVRLTENVDVSVIERLSISGSFIGVFSDADYTRLEHVVLDSELSGLNKRMFVGINISNADNGDITNVTTRNLDTAIVISFTDKTSITNSSFMAVDNGIEIDQSEQVTITNNSFFDIQESAIKADEVTYLTVSDNLLQGSQSEIDSSAAIIFNNITLIEGGDISHNIFETWGNALSDRTQYGGGGPTPTFSLNTFINTIMKYVLPRTASAQSETVLKIIENDFINTIFPHAFTLAAEPYVRFSNIEGEGNYWDVFDEPNEGCLDENVDNICDDPYQQTGPYLADMFPVALAYSIDVSTPETPECSIVITPTSITIGESANLTFTMTDADQAIVSGIGEVTTDQSLIVSPTATTTYTANVWGVGGSAKCSAVLGVVEIDDAEEPPEDLPLNLQAAKNAVTLVDQPDGYLWGGKGWDFNLSKFVPASTILSGYSYYNPDLKSTDTGVGVDCSGLVAWAYNFANDAGKSFVNNFIAYEGSAGQATDAQSVAVEGSDLRPGDTLYFDFSGDGRIDHTAMYVGDQGGYDVVSAGSDDLGIEPHNLATYSKIPDFKYFRRPSNPKIAMAVQVSSPVDLVVTDPDGNTIEPTTAFITEREYIREVPGELYYSESVTKAKKWSICHQSSSNNRCRAKRNLLFELHS